jgi:DNA-binding NarL/FixJ family response regulator
MANLTPIRILLVEDEDGDLFFIREALDEAAALGAWPGRALAVSPAATLGDACDLIFDGAFDAILLNLSLPDSPIPHETFQKVSEFARSLPIVILADQEDEAFAALLLRQGAQSFLPKHALDAIPLATSVNHAIERQRYVNALRAPAEPPLAAILPQTTEAADDGNLLSLIHVTGVAANGPEVKTVMLAD